MQSSLIPLCFGVKLFSIDATVKDYLRYLNVIHILLKLFINY